MTFLAFLASDVMPAFDDLLFNPRPRSD